MDLAEAEPGGEELGTIKRRKNGDAEMNLMAVFISIPPAALSWSTYSIDTRW
jgi:hypothetical protein